MRKLFLTTVSFRFLSLLAAGCDNTYSPASSAKDENDIVIVFIPKATEKAFFEAVDDGVQQ